VLIFKKDIEGEITILAEMHKNEGYLLVFDAWRQKKKRLRKDTTAQKPSANVQDESPHADTSLSNNPANLSTPNHERGIH
jgi:hypothetical protein